MKSKLDPNSFPIANPYDWLIFTKEWQKNIDFLFACRLAALAAYKNKKINISSGYRSIEEQIHCYKESGGVLINGVWAGGSGYAAKPGRSWHEYRLAIDTSDIWLKVLEKGMSTNNQVTLMRFGLFKPLTKGNRSSVRQDGHIQPIETAGIKDRGLLEPDLYNKLQKGMNGIEVMELQWILAKHGHKNIQEENFGEITEEEVKNFQRNKHLPESGMIDIDTWKALYYI